MVELLHVENEKEILDFLNSKNISKIVKVKEVTFWNNFLFTKTVSMIQGVYVTQIKLEREKNFIYFFEYLLIIKKFLYFFFLIFFPFFFFFLKIIF